MICCVFIADLTKYPNFFTTVRTVCGFFHVWVHGRGGQDLGKDWVVGTFNSHPMGFAKDILAV